MRPDKKGNRKRDEKRNGPKSAPQKPAGPQKSLGQAQKSQSVAQKAPVAAPPPVEQTGTAHHQGLRVLEPVAPPPSDAARYRRREIRSNWHRYEEEPAAEAAPDEDFLRGDTFDELLAASGEFGRRRTGRGAV